MGAAVRDFSPRRVSDGWNDERICAERGAVEFGSPILSVCRGRRGISGDGFAVAQGSPWKLARWVCYCAGVAVEFGAMDLATRRGRRGSWRDGSCNA